jgi:hypothetical protein
MGSRGDYLPLRVQGSALLKWRAFTEADLRSKSAQRAQIGAPQGHALGGRTPDTHRVAATTMRKRFKCPCSGELSVFGCSADVFLLECRRRGFALRYGVV